MKRPGFTKKNIASNLKCDESECQTVWADFLKSKIFTGDHFNPEVQVALKNIFEMDIQKQGV